MLARAGVAETGSLLLGDDALAPRLLSMLADVCVALLPAGSIIADLDEDLRQSIARIKASPFVPHKDSIRGFVFDVATGRLNEVK